MMYRMLEWHIEIYIINLLIVTRFNIHSKRYILVHKNVDMKEKFQDKKVGQVTRKRILII